jgi:hypothetical protein
MNWCSIPTPCRTVASYFGSIERRPAFEHYWARIGQREAAVRARKIDDALLPPPAAKPAT